MLAEKTVPASHAGEDQSSVPTSAPVQCWSISFPQYGARSLTELAKHRQWLRPGDVVYIADVRRHILTEADLNSAARAAIGGAV